MKIVVFDFDKTLIKEDSLTKLFIKLSIKKPIFLILFLTLACFYKLNLISNDYMKRTLLKNIIGESSEISSILNKNIVFKHTVLLNILLYHLKKGDLCIISSGTIREILEKYIKDFDLIYNNIFLSSSEYYNLNSKLKYYNNFGVNKLDSLKKMGYQEIDILFTDDLKADRPLLSISKSVYLMSNLRLTSVKSI